MTQPCVKITFVFVLNLSETTIRFLKAKHLAASDAGRDG